MKNYLDVLKTVNCFKALKKQIYSPFIVPMRESDSL
jgi:hypothetical protein